MVKLTIGRLDPTRRRSMKTNFRCSRLRSWLPIATRVADRILGFGLKSGEYKNQLAIVLCDRLGRDLR